MLEINNLFKYMKYMFIYIGYVNLKNLIYCNRIWKVYEVVVFFFCVVYLINILSMKIMIVVVLVKCV